MIFCPLQQQQQNQDEERLLFQPRETTSLRIVLQSTGGKDGESSGDSSSPPAVAPTAPRYPLPSPGTPISISQFADLTPVEQKQWLAAGSAGSSKKSNKKKVIEFYNDNNNCPTQLDGDDCCFSELRLPASSSLDSMSSAGSSSTNKTDETDSLTSVGSSSSRAADEEDEQDHHHSAITTTFNKTVSSNTTTTKAKKNAAPKRSIFAPYWAKAGQGGAQEERSKESSDYGKKISTESNSERSDATAAQQTVPASPPTGAVLHPSSPSSAARRSIFGLQTQSPRVRSRSTNKNICEIDTLAPRFVYVPARPKALSPIAPKKARSASALLDRPKTSILRSTSQERGDGGGPSRQRCHSFSVTFDSKVDVVLFSDPPSAYQSSPWWLRLVGGGGSTSCSTSEDEDSSTRAHRTISSKSRHPAAIANKEKTSTARLLPWESL